VDDVPFPIDHDIPVMPILDLQDVASHRVRRHGLDKVQSGFLERHRIDSAILVDEVGDEIVDLGSTHLVSRSCIWYNVDDTTLLESAGIED